ncbi:unnamed protein product [Ilex paraguariensis]|uniref:Uncharacterized protein n=1 Tax=Ilex paraguariensis TaxID=185542 RepID=A0ABC8SCJ4_9AQUA
MILTCNVPPVRTYNILLALEQTSPSFGVSVEMIDDSAPDHLEIMMMKFFVSYQSHLRNVNQDRELDSLILLVSSNSLSATSAASTTLA